MEKSSRPARAGGPRQSACPRGLGRVQAGLPWPSEIEARRPVQTNAAHEVQSMTDRRLQASRASITRAQTVSILSAESAADPDLAACRHAACCHLPATAL